MSIVRTTFCTLVTRGAGGGRSPRKYGFNGTMPAFTSSRVGSSTPGSHSAPRDGRATRSGRGNGGVSLRCPSTKAPSDRFRRIGPLGRRFNAQRRAQLAFAFGHPGAYLPHKSLPAKPPAAAPHCRAEAIRQAAVRRRITSTPTVAPSVMKTAASSWNETLARRFLSGFLGLQLGLDPSGNVGRIAAGSRPADTVGERSNLDHRAA